MIGNIIIKLIGPLLKIIFPKIEERLSEVRQEIIEHIFKVGKLEENTRYREEPNEADKRLDKVEEQLKMVAKDIYTSVIDLKELEQKITDQGFRMTKLIDMVKARDEIIDNMTGDMKKIRNMKVFKKLG